MSVSTGSPASTSRSPARPRARPCRRARQRPGSRAACRRRRSAESGGRSALSRCGSKPASAGSCSTIMARIMADVPRAQRQAFTKPALVQCRDPNLETMDARIVDRPLRPCGTSLRCTGAGTDRPERHPPDPAPPHRTAVGRRARRFGDLRRGRPLGRQHQPVAARRPTRWARPPTTTSPAPSRRPAAIARSRPRSTSATACRARTSPARAPRTYSRMSDGKFKPGIDFYNVSGRKGQALATRRSSRRTGT